MRRINIFAYLLIFLFAYLLIAQSTFAHVLKSNGTIGAIMHIDPNDDPIAEQQASMFFEFKDTTNTFTPQNCDCTIKIIENSQTIYAQPLFQNTPSPSVYNASVSYTFPRADVYQVIVTGSPTAKNTFQSFTLTYTVRAEQPNTASQTPQHKNFIAVNFGYIIALSILVLFLVGKAISNYRRHKSIFPK